jgi:GWxTD domain-containing protein
VRTTTRVASVVAAVLLTSAPGARGQFPPRRAEAGPQVLFYEAFPIPLAEDSIHQRIDVHYRIDREFFVSVRDPEGHSPFHRSGEVVVELADSTGTVAARQMRSIEITDTDPERKPMGEQWEQGIFSLVVSPGTYRITITVDDLESRRTIMDSSRTVKALPRIHTGLGTASAIPVAPPGETRGIPATLRLMNYGGDILFGRPAALLVVWHGGPHDTLLTVRYSFAEEPPAQEDRPFLVPDGMVRVPVYRGVTLVPEADSPRAAYAVRSDPSGSTCAAIVPLPFARLLLRSYRMKFAFSEGSDTSEIVRRARTVWPDMPFSLKDIDNALDALRYVTTESQLDSLRSGNLARRRANLEGFWRSKGGRPETAFNEVITEYYRRVDYATRNFGTLRQPDGFRSDRGRIYVLHGPPTGTDRTLDPVSGFKEVWTYARLRKKFIFVDQNRSGNYILVSTTAL